MPSERRDEPEPPAGMVRLRIDQIDSNPHQPRQEFDAQELQSLSESISAHGLVAAGRRAQAGRAASS